MRSVVLHAVLRVAGILLAVAGGVDMERGRAQDQPAVAPGDGSGEDLATVQARLADRFNRLEVLAERLAELSRATQPRRANLLRDLVARSREENVPGQFDAVVAALQKESYSAALSGQSQLHNDLEQLLELLLQEDRDRRLDNEQKRIRRYLQDVNRLIRLQRGVKARTDGGDDEKSLAGDQERIGDETGKVGKQIEDAEGVAEAKRRREGSAAKGAQGGKGAKDAKGQGEGGPQEESKGAESENSPKEGGGRPGSSPSGEPKDGKGSDQKGGKPSPGGGQPGEPKESSGKPSQGGQPGGQSGGQSSPSEDQQSQDPGPQQSPMERTAEKLRAAQQRMGEAQKKLEESKRSESAEEQAKAVEELEQAKAELERILRQLREEELERMLVLLEARFRKMLDEQVEIYDETKRLDAAAAKAPMHELEIAGGRLSRREQVIVRDADRALVLLREDGTSVAFPEAVEQARDDMQSVAKRLGDTKFEMITQGLEEDVIAALEETLAALAQAIKDLRNQKARQQPGQGSPGDQPLVDQLAELRMIRALQMRVNRRTRQYGAMVTGEQAEDVELLKALDQLALRQQKIFQATHDLGTKEN